MATNEIARGFMSRAAFKKNTNAWGTGTAVLCAADNGFTPTSFDITPNIEVLANESFHGSSVQRKGEPGQQLHEGSIECYAKYQGLDGLIGAAFGNAETPIIVSGTAYYSDFTLAETMKGLYWTVCAHDGSTNGVGGERYIREYSHVKITRLRIFGTFGQWCMCEFGCLARDLEINDTAGINKDSTWDAVTETDKDYVVLYNDSNLGYTSKIWMNDQDGADFVAADAIYPSEFEFVLERNLTGEVTSEAAPYMSEPTINDWTTCTVRLNFPTASAWTHWDNWTAGTPQKLKFQFEGGAITGGGGNNFGLEIWIPYADITLAARPLTSVGKLAEPLELACKYSETNPTGFPTFGSTHPTYLPFLRLTNENTAAAY